MVVPGAMKFHYLLACITVAMLFGMVSGHFRVGRQLYVWNEQPCPWPRYPVLRERLFSKLSPEWPGADKNFKTEEREEEGTDSRLPTEAKSVNDLRAGFLKRMKTLARKYQVSEEGSANKNRRVAPSPGFVKNGN